MRVASFAKAQNGSKMSYWLDLGLGVGMTERGNDKCVCIFYASECNMRIACTYAETGENHVLLCQQCHTVI